MWLLTFSRISFYLKAQSGFPPLQTSTEFSQVSFIKELSFLAENHKTLAHKNLS